MNSKKNVRTLAKLFVSLSVTAAASGCVTIPNTKACAVAGVLSAGGICAESLSGKTSDMTFEEFLDFLEPQRERPDPSDPTKTLPARAGAVCRSAEDENKIKTTLERACREMGPNCDYEQLQTVFQNAERLKNY